MSFQFSLQKVLDLRGRLEQEAAIEFGRRQTQVIEAKRKLQSQYEQRLEQLTAWRSRIVGALDVNELELHQRYLALLDEAIREQEALIDQLESAVEAQRAEYLDCRRKREALDKLRENELLEFRQELMSREQKALDDVAGTRFVRQEALIP